MRLRIVKVINETERHPKYNKALDKLVKEMSDGAPWAASNPFGGVEAAQHLITPSTSREHPLQKLMRGTYWRKAALQIETRIEEFIEEKIIGKAKIGMKYSSYDGTRKELDGLEAHITGFSHGNHWGRISKYVNVEWIDPPEDIWGLPGAISKWYKSNAVETIEYSIIEGPSFDDLVTYLRDT